MYQIEFSKEELVSLVRAMSISGVLQEIPPSLRSSISAKLVMGFAQDTCSGIEISSGAFSTCNMALNRPPKQSTAIRNRTNGSEEASA